MDETEDIEELRAAGMKLRQKGNTWRVQDPDGPRYKALGNSWAVNCAEWIGERTAMVNSFGGRSMTEDKQPTISMKIAPRFAMISEREFRRLRADDQNQIYLEAGGFAPVSYANRNADTRWTAVQQAKAVYWNERVDEQAPVREAKALKGREGLISAAEVNAGLRTLPPVPIYGEEG